MINNLHLSNLSIYKQSKKIENVEHIYYIKKTDYRLHQHHYLIIETANEKVKFYDVKYDEYVSIFINFLKLSYFLWLNMITDN
jgi:hypothetical protein